MKADRRIKLGLVAGLALLLGLLVGAPVFAESPSPSASAPAVTPGPSTSSAPCPNPTPTATPTPDPAVSPTPTPAGQTPAPTRAPNLCPAVAGADIGSTLAWLFTPIFQAIFLGLVISHGLVGDMGFAIIAVTILIRLLLVPMFRRQIVSQRRTQALQPELKALQARFKGDKQKLQQEQMRFYKERGVNPLAGCLPSIVQMFLLLPDVLGLLQRPLGPGHQLDAERLRVPPRRDLPGRRGHRPGALHQPPHLVAGRAGLEREGGLRSSSPRACRSSAASG